MSKFGAAKNKPLKLIVDTCVWLDLAKDNKQRSNLHVLEELVRNNLVALVVPQIVLDEFNRNKARVVDEIGKSVTTTLKRARDIIVDLGDRRRTESAKRLLNEADFRIAGPGEESKLAIGRIAALLANATVVPTSQDMKARAAERAILGVAPFHRQKNSIGDALLIEAYADLSKQAKAGERFGFVTHNTKDFSEPGASHKNPHPDIAPLFSRIKSRYFITLGEAMKSIQPRGMDEIFVEDDFDMPPRSLDEIVSAIDEFVEKVWYNRHKNREWAIQHKKIEIVETYDRARHNETIVRRIWEGALKSAARVEKRFKDEQLLWDDFEWGMLNGKLSALRWVLGEDWDMLYT